MSSDGKFDIYEQAKRKYDAMRELFSKASEAEFYSELPAKLKDALNEYNTLRRQFLKASEAGYYSRFPAELDAAIRKYEESPYGIRECQGFEDALGKSWRQVRVPSELMPELEKILSLRPKYFDSA
jgi:hypothetical protein